MGHLIFVGDGCPEAHQLMKRQLDRHCFGKGNPCRLREIHIYDLQFDSEDRDAVLNDFNYGTNEIQFKDGFSYKFRMKEAPFKHGKLRAAISIFVKIVGWPFGVKGIKWGKEKSAWQVAKAGLNIYPLAEVDDNFIMNFSTEKEEEWL